ncbi:MAG: FecCD family ABC transporter permease [Pseudochelatococcus sp.]|jgi:iron complex transport system permease protein|uniref:FecCD family ABC transporter permease n=1 Tax=Pseudochelatococcus sp. TaxID=2020869 RepID=UPI003D913EBC
MTCVADDAGTRAPFLRRRRARGFVAGVLALGALALVSLVVGSRPVPLAEAFDALRAYDAGNDRHLVIRELRVPRTFVAVLAGLALGVAGAVMQAVTRNPLAEPGLLGINAGAAAGVVIGVAAFGAATMAHYVWFAFAGAGLAGVAVFLLGQAHRTGIDPVRLVLAGAGLSIMLASVTGIVILNAPLAVFDDFRNWAAGSVEGRGLDVAGVLALAVAAGLGMALPIAGSLNAMALGSDLGRALGVDARVTWLLACLSVMLLSGAATAAAGPIAFVGLAAPHAARMMTGPDYRWILPGSALLAAILLLGADVLGRLIAAPSEVAAGIVASLLGGPFFIAVARRFRLMKP